MEPDINCIAMESIILTDGCTLLEDQNLNNSLNEPLHVAYEQVVSGNRDENECSIKDNDEILCVTNPNEDESMAVEALQQLSTSNIPNKFEITFFHCSQCNRHFQNIQIFQSHLSNCENGRLKCQICGKAFEKLFEFNNHLICHAVQRPHSCRMCGLLFIKQQNLSKHLETHKQMFKRNLYQNADFDQHHENSDVADASHMYACKICDRTFKRSSSLTNHMKIHKYQPARDVISSLINIKSECDVESGNSEEDLRINPLPSLNNHLNLSTWEDCGIIQSEDCNSNINFQLDINQEVTVSSYPEDEEDYNSLTLSFEPEESNSKSLVDSGDTVNNRQIKPYKCNSCNKQFAREKALLSHLKLHTAILDTSYNCKNCGVYVEDDKALSEHLKSCSTQSQKSKSVVENKVFNVEALHQDAEQPGYGIKITDPRTLLYKHKCTQCDKTFSTKQKLFRHMWIHRKKIFSCEICACCFEKREELDNHRLSQHQGNSAYVCTECGKSFSSRQGLWEHNHRIHSNTFHLYKCTDCAKKFSSRQGYLIHRRTHNNERPYGCRYCWKSFRDGGTLRKHERIHTGERPHVCPLCTKAFNQKVVLREHIRWLHSANKQPNQRGTYECTLCEQEVTDQDDLCTHIIKHSDEMAKGLIRAPEANKCDDTYNEPKQEINVVEDDIETEKHSDEDLLNDDTWECTLCGSSFACKKDLSAHITVHI